MDGSRFDWELRSEQVNPADAVTPDHRGFAAEAAELSGPLDRPGAPMAAWAPILIWTTLGVTIAISVAL